jgi:hypothetical protein
MISVKLSFLLLMLVELLTITLKLSFVDVGGTVGDHCSILFCCVDVGRTVDEHC